MLRGKKILLGITGSIAAYKIPLLIRLLKKEGAEVKVLLSPFAKEFVTPLTLSTLSGNPVLSKSHDPETGKWNSHVDLGLWADLFLIAPLTANSMAKLVSGVADNFLLTTSLSVRCPLMFAPAMDLDMYKHPSTQDNIQSLQKRGNILIAPTEGELASGLCGEGRMEDPEKIFKAIEGFFTKSQQLKGRKILITAGPTYEAIDPVRFIGNHSSGLMGFSLAQILAERGAEVILVAGPTAMQINHPNVFRIDVISADEMYKACTNIFADVDLAILSAAVADFKPATAADQKIKKEVALTQIKLEKTPDILAELGKRKSQKQFLIGFALETENEQSNAKKKIENKNLDFIVLNSLKDKGAGFKLTTNKVSIIHKNGKQTDFELKPKIEVAGDIVDELVGCINQQK
jgi:phosphopantothenoylcysteine decarboxylase / phosphopantothenate---cysteine ligase